MTPRYSVRQSPPMNFWERIYLVEIAKGLSTTLSHLLKNLFGITRIQTYEYPEEPKPIPEGYRSEHRLMLREDETVRCTACMLCATACPAECIEIVAKENPDPNIEKQAEVFNIDMLRCVFCGMCVEACPCDAIRMDTKRMDMADFTRTDFIYDITRLAANHPNGMSPYSKAIY